MATRKEVNATGPPRSGKSALFALIHDEAERQRKRRRACVKIITEIETEFIERANNGESGNLLKELIQAIERRCARSSAPPKGAGRKQQNGKPLRIYNAKKSKSGRAKTTRKKTQKRISTKR